MRCVACTQPKPGSEFWHDGEHWRICRACRESVENAVRVEMAREPAMTNGDPPRLARAPRLHFEPHSRLPHGNNYRVVPSTQLPRSILRVIRQLGVRA